VPNDVTTVLRAGSFERIFPRRLTVLAADARVTELAVLAMM